MNPQLPSIEPVTGLPVINDPSLQTAGRFNTPTIMDKILSFLPLLKHSAEGSISINPKNSNDPALAIKHEALHSVLNILNKNGQLDKMNAENPAFQQIMKNWPSWAGEPNQEIPVYAATGELQKLNIPGMTPELQKAGVGTLVQQLMKLDPKTLEKYQRLSQ